MVIEDEEDRLLLGSEGNYEATVNGPSYQEVEENREDSLTEVVPFPNQRFYIITAVLVISLYVLALNVSSFALVLALVGATGSTAISFTLPGLFGYKLIGSQAARNGQLMSRSDKFLKSCSLALAIYGLAVMFLSLYVTIKYGA